MKNKVTKEYCQKVLFPELIHEVGAWGFVNKISIKKIEKLKQTIFEVIYQNEN